MTSLYVKCRFENMVYLLKKRLDAFALIVKAARSFHKIKEYLFFPQLQKDSNIYMFVL